MHLTRAAAVATVPVLPLMLLQVMNRVEGTGKFPVALFAVLWVLAFAIVLLVLAGVGSAARGRAHLSLPRILAVAGLLCIAWVWVGIVVDQMPCFLGVPNCD